MRGFLINITFKNYDFRATLNSLLAELVDFDLLVTVTFTIYTVPTTSFPVVTGMSAVDDSMDLLSTLVLSDSFLVARSSLTPKDGIFEETFTVKA
jgi:hypothetical protein